MTSPQGTLGAGNRYERPRHTTFHVCVTTHLKSIQWDPMGRRLLGACAWCFSDFSVFGFSAAELALNPFTVITLSCEYDYMLRPESPPRE